MKWFNYCFVTISLFASSHKSGQLLKEILFFLLSLKSGLHLNRYVLQRGKHKSMYIRFGNLVKRGKLANLYIAVN